MKVYIGKYPSSVSCYWLVQKIFFWKDKNDDFLLNLSHFLTYGSFEEDEQKSDESTIEFLKRSSKRERTKLAKFLESFNKYVSKQPTYVKIDHYDTWNLDSTLSKIILPALKEFRQHDFRSIKVDLEDVPDILHPTQEEKETLKEYETDSKYWERTDYVLDEMIFSFDAIVYGWEREEQDLDYFEKHNKRIDNGLRLFGKYFRSLWT